MNATQLTLAGSFLGVEADRPAPGPSALSPFRRVLDETWPQCEERLAKLAIGLGLRGEQAADVLQDVYVTAVQKPPAIDDEAELVRWLFRVTVNRCQLEHRRRGRWRRLWSSLAGAWKSEGTSAAALAVNGELKQQVADALASLTSADRELVAMRYFSNLNSREIAAIVGIPEATIRGRLRSARRKLSDLLADWSDHG